MSEVINITGLFKKYNPKLDYAISDINIKANEGEIVGLLGHNGAGKSTTLKCLMGMLPFDLGEISVCGYSLKTNSVEAKSNMGFVTDNHAVFVKMTGYEYLNFMADIYGTEQAGRREYVEKLDSVFELGTALNNLIASYSHGMKQKVCMMGSLMHKPKLWILDEPMTGLDPSTMRAVANFVYSYAKVEGNTVIFSSHDIPTVSKLCDRVVIINSGKMKADVVISDLQKEKVNLEEYFFDSYDKTNK